MGSLGEVSKCPACGALVPALSVKCPDCGHEFSNVAVNSTVAALMQTLDTVDRQCARTGDKNLAVERKVQTIKNFPIPNTKQDLIEMLTVCETNLKAKSENYKINDAWKAKSEQIKQKIQLLLKDDTEAQSLLQTIEAGKAAKRKRASIITIIIISLIIVLVGALMISRCNSSVKEESSNQQLIEMQTQINKNIRAEKYQEAYDGLQDIYTYMQTNKIGKEEFKDLLTEPYTKIVISQIQDGDLEGAAIVGLEYRERLGNDKDWKSSQIYKLLIQECEAQNVDDSPLR